MAIFQLLLEVKAEHVRRSAFPFRKETVATQQVLIKKLPDTIVLYEKIIDDQGKRILKPWVSNYSFVLYET